MDTGRVEDHAERQGLPSISEKLKRSRLLKEWSVHLMVGIGRVEDDDGKLFAFYFHSTPLMFAFLPLRY
jgi:hypothetical protein